MTHILASPANHPRFSRCELVHQSKRSTVWKCWDEQLDCWVAVKTSADADSAAQANLLASLDHPCIVRSFGDVRLAGGAASSLILEYVQGKTLDDLLATGERMPERTAVNLLKKCCSALELLHLSHVVHGDLAPNNIIASQEADTLKLIDFEIPLAKTAESTNLHKRSRGTPVAMSPEVASGQSPTPLSDIYSLGCIGYYLLTGKYVYSGATSLEICWKQIRRPCPSLSSDTAVSPPLAQLIDHMLQKSPSGRPQSVRLVSDQLATFLTGIGKR